MIGSASWKDELAACCYASRYCSSPCTKGEEKQTPPHRRFEDLFSEPFSRLCWSAHEGLTKSIFDQPVRLYFIHTTLPQNTFTMTDNSLKGKHVNVAMMTSGGLAPCLSSSISQLAHYWVEALKNGEIAGLTLRMYRDGYKGVLIGDSFIVPEEDWPGMDALNFIGGSPIGNSRVKVRLSKMTDSSTVVTGRRHISCTSHSHTHTIPPSSSAHKRGRLQEARLCPGGRNSSRSGRPTPHQGRGPRPAHDWRGRHQHASRRALQVHFGTTRWQGGCRGNAQDD